MGKKYVTVPNEKRHQIVKLINEDGMTVAEAAKAVDVFYPTAKAIQQIYSRTGRIDKKNKHKKTKYKRKKRRRDPENVSVSSSSFDPEHFDSGGVVSPSGVQSLPEESKAPLSDVASSSKQCRSKVNYDD